VLQVLLNPNQCNQTEVNWAQRAATVRCIWLDPCDVQLSFCMYGDWKLSGESRMHQLLFYFRYTRWSKKTDTHFIFGITSVIQHRF